MEEKKTIGENGIALYMQLTFFKIMNEDTFSGFALNNFCCRYGISPHLMSFLFRISKGLIAFLVQCLFS